MGDKNPVTEAIEAITNRVTSFFVGEPPIITEIIPRRADKIFTKPPFASATTEVEITGDMFLNRLPKWKSYEAPEAPILPPHCSLDSLLHIKPTEHRFYVDLATQTNSIWYARKKISVLCLRKKPNNKYLPVVNAPVTVSRKSGNTNIQFALPNGTMVQLLEKDNRPVTNSQGIAEFTIVFPTQLITVDNSLLEVRVTIPPKTDKGQQLVSTKTISIPLFRNSRFTDIEKIISDRNDIHSAARIWTYQPTALETTENAGIRELQEIINEIVPRHRGITAAADNFTYLTLDGVFNENTKRMLGKYLEKFPNISNTEYPYNLTQIGPDPDFLNVVKEDYAPFDPTLPANRGWIVDRRLLIGDRYDIAPANIDGLYELYMGVAMVLRDAVEALVDEYINCPTIYLHRPIHNPYSAASDKVFACHLTGANIRENAQVTAVTLGTMNDGDHALVISQPTPPTGWVKIRHEDIEGWVQVTNGVVVKNDRGRFRAVGQQVRNVGHPGVCYSYGAKQRPSEWTNSLQTNPHANPDQIASFEEYAAGHRFGGNQAEWNSGVYSFIEAGCDCSGFVQNCYAYACFSDGTTRIIPNSLLSPPVGNGAIGSGGFIGDAARARLVPNPTSLNNNWVRMFDIFAGSGHIAMVANERPPAPVTPVDFNIFHECATPIASSLAFTRKAIRSPVSWGWGNIVGKTFGKIYVWH